MNRVLIIFLSALLSAAIPADGQPVKELQTGDQMPDITIEKVNNYPASTIRMGELKDKLVILDFWGTHCVPCIKALPHLQELQKQFNDKIVILPVTSQEQGIKEFLQKRSIIIPNITGDKQLREMFPHRVIPHEVWIKDGRVAAITSHTDVTAENIERILKGETGFMKVKKEFIETDENKLLKGYPVTDDDIVYRSVLLQYKADAPGGISVTRSETDGIKRVYAGNLPAVVLFNHAAFEGQVAMFNINRVILDVTDTARYYNSTVRKAFPRGKWNTPDEYKAENQFIYELSLPDTVSRTRFYTTMMEDLNRLFPLKAKVEEREVPALILTRINTQNDLLKTKGGKPQTLMMPQIVIANGSLDFLMVLLNNWRDLPPVFNETGYSGNVDLSIDYSKSSTWKMDVSGLPLNAPLDMQLMRTELNKYGLDLVPGKRKARVLILSDKPEVYNKWK